MRSALYYLNSAAESNYIERMKYLTSYLIHSFHLNLYSYKPFNPVIGETFQSIVKIPNNPELGLINVYAEQTSHHPPILNFYAIHDKFKVYGYRGGSVKGAGNSIVADVSGSFFVEFNDKTKYSVRYGQFEMSGILIGQRQANFKGNFIIEDLTNGMISIFQINPKEKQNFFGKLFSKKPETFPDFVKGFITDKSKVLYDKSTETYSVDDKFIYSRYEGEYMTHLTFDNKLYWHTEEKKIPMGSQFKMQFTLPSDSLIREDLLLYKKGRTELAQYAKMMIEDIQRKDAKLRKSTMNV